MKAKAVICNGDVMAKPTPILCSTRLMVALIGFLMFFHLYALRIGMSVAIVCMVNHTAVANLSAGEGRYNGTDLLEGEGDNVTLGIGRNRARRCAFELNETEEADGPFVWTRSTQGHILGSFFYGYLISQIPGGLLAEKFGGKWVLFGSLALASVATLLAPIAAYVNVGFLIFLRVVLGIGSGALYPATHALLGQWAPPLERSILCGMTYAGAMMGNVVALPVSGFLCHYGFADGWGSIFYVFGTTCLICIIIWALVTSNSPATHPCISTAEKTYIIQSLRGEVSETKTDWCDMPWLEMLKSGPVWAIIIGNFTTDWGLYTYMTNIPTFYKEILKFDIRSNGLFSALPFIGHWITMIICPICVDSLRSRHILSTVACRKICNTIGLAVAGLVLIGLSYLDCTQTAAAVTLLTIAVSLSGFCYSGYFVNHMDIAPKYAGTLMGISNAVASCSGFLAPLVAAKLTEDGTRESWQKVFFIAAAVFIVGAILFCVLAAGEVQQWAREEVSEDEEEGEMKVMPPVNFQKDRAIYRPKVDEMGTQADNPMLAAPA